MSYEELKQKLNNNSKDDLIYHLWFLSKQLEASRSARNRLEVENQALRIGLESVSNVNNVQK